MKKMWTFVLLGLLAWTTHAVAGAGKGSLDNWRQAVSTNEFKKTLAAARTISEEWPSVHSVKYAGERDAESGLSQIGYRDLARTFLLGLKSYEKLLREMPPKAFCEGADELLDVRGRFLKNPGYVNYFLADSINRVIYVNLGERLARPADVPACYDKIVARLAEFRCDFPQIVSLINEEYGSNVLSMAEIKDLPLTDQLQTVGRVIGQVNFFFITQDAHNLYGLRMLEQRSLSALVSRLVSSDYFIGASLPALLSYRRETTRFSPIDSSLQVGSVLGNETRLPPTLLDGQPRAASVVSCFLREVRSEQWGQRLCFFDPPALTEEIIYTLERQEVEREAAN